ncbi:MAG TPA: ABC transporter permease subunit [Gemmataceae bacterium]|jgi:ABC-type transport system involved in multi-copper enzyme maturation permease subunit|nr:ABC transporter permease subunit [Gemmataceae bacterium]
MGSPDQATFLLDRKWPFRIAPIIWAAVGVGAYVIADGLDRPAQFVMAGLWVVGLGLLLHKFVRSLLGPVLAYDVLRVGRKPRQIWFRVAYAILLAILFTWVYLAWVSFNGTGRVQPKVMSKLAETFFTVYMVVQFILVCLLTPASVAGAIADEKERRTLEFLLATDLRDREILFGKLASRVGSLLLFLLAGLPILAMLQFFGGIDPDLVLAGFAATFATCLSIAAVAIASSVLSRRARDAIALCYLLLIVYVLLSGVAYALSAAPYIRDWLNFEIFGYTITSEDVGYLTVTGNPFFMVPYTMARRSMMAVDLFQALRHYLLFHALVIGVFVAWAGLRLRSIALAQQFGGAATLWSRWRRGRKTKTINVAGGTPVKRRRARSRRARPAVNEQPILWKEIFVDTGLRLGRFGQVIVLGLVLLSFVPMGLIFWFAIVDPSSYNAGSSWLSPQRWDNFRQGMNMYLRSAGTVATCLVFLAINIRGAGCISGERDRHTLDALLTTPLAARTIVWGKWWGCLLGMRWAWAWIFAMWVLTLAAGAVHPVMFVAGLASIAIYASGGAWIGIFCSLHFRTTLRSTMASIVATVFLGGGYFLIFLMCCFLPLSFASGSRNGDFDVLIDLLSSISPPVNIAWLPIEEFKDHALTLSHHDIPYVPFWLLGLGAWVGISFGLSRACVSKFRQMANRNMATPELPRRASSDV